MTPDFVRLMDSASTTLLAVTFAPIAVSAVLIVLSFRNYGYGAIGWTLSGGFLVLAGSIALGIWNSLQPMALIRFIAGITRLTGWALIAWGTWFFWRQSKRTRRMVPRPDLDES